MILSNFLCGNVIFNVRREGDFLIAEGDGFVVQGKDLNQLKERANKTVEGHILIAKSLGLEPFECLKK